MTGAPIDDEALLTESRALGDPTRLAVFCFVRDSIEPVGVAELTDKFTLHHNAIRQHLAKLRDAGLVVEESAPSQGPGRPRLMYRVTPGVAERVVGPGPFEALSMMLLSLLRGEGSPVEVGRRVGKTFAVEHGIHNDALTILTGVARRMGFEPQVDVTDVGGDVVLERCPFLGPAGTSPEIVCAIHRGIAEGIAEASADAAIITDLEVHSPVEAHCRIVVDTPLKRR